MEFSCCKFYPNAVICNNKEDYRLIRSACGPNINYSSGQNIVLCSNVGIIVRCSEGHRMTYTTSELINFAHKASVKCRLCGQIAFVRDAELICLSDVKSCKKQL